jgi:hypothetical protein
MSLQKNVYTSSTKRNVDEFEGLRFLGREPLSRRRASESPTALALSLVELMRAIAIVQSRHAIA